MAIDEEDVIVLDSEPEPTEFTVETTRIPAFEYEGQKYPQTIIFTHVEKDEKSVYIVKEFWIKFEDKWVLDEEEYADLGHPEHAKNIANGILKVVSDE